MAVADWLDLARLVAAGVAPTQARTFLAPLRAACEAFRIDTPARAAGFIAQCCVESTGFTRLEEDLFYRKPEWLRQVFSSYVPSLAVAQTLTRNPRALANRVYAGRLGNGSEASGDGWAYRGRGLLQLTGRDNYANAERALALPLLVQPELAAEPTGACLTAAWYWHTRKLNHLADSAQWDAITRAVNGPAMLHAAQRRQMSSDAALALMA
jgi:putative chitinase